MVHGLDLAREATGYIVCRTGAFATKHFPQCRRGQMKWQQWVLPPVL